MQATARGAITIYARTPGEGETCGRRRQHRCLALGGVLVELLRELAGAPIYFWRPFRRSIFGNPFRRTPAGERPRGQIESEGAASEKRVSGETRISFFYFFQIGHGSLGGFAGRHAPERVKKKTPSARPQSRCRLVASSAV